MSPQAVQFKAIKPKKLQDKALLRELDLALTEQKNEMLRDFEKTVKYWKRKPKFENLRESTPDGPALIVGTDDEIYGYVDEGTKPHIIRPRAAKALHFQSGYRAKTMPRVIDSKRGGAYGDPVTAAVVHHPGTEAREFAKTIQKDHEKKFKRRMEQAMRDAAAVSGHKA
jgi:hypothetical protein